MSREGVYLMVSKKLRFLQAFCWLLFIGWAILSFTLSQQDGVSSEQVSAKATRLTERILMFLGIDPDIPDLYMKLRKFAHFCVHFVLAALACFAFATSIRKLFWAILAAFIISTGIALVDEFIQLSADGRVFLARDILINVSGVTLGTLFATLTIIAIIKPKNILCPR